MYEEEPFEEQHEPSPSYQHDPPRSEIQFTARSVEPRTCEVPSYHNDRGHIMMIYTHGISQTSTECLSNVVP